MTSTAENNQIPAKAKEPKPHETFPTAAPSSTSGSQDPSPDMGRAKLGTHIMGPPAVPTTHPDNQKAALWGADQNHRHDFQPQPYLLYSPVQRPSNNPLDPVVHMLNSWSNRAETTARNLWHNREF